MASISLGEYTQFFGLDNERRMPITVIVTAANVANATFHRVRLTVKIGSSDFEFASMVTDGGTAQFDISTAFIAVHDSYRYTSGNIYSTVEYPAYTATMTACDDYMVDGELHEGQNSSSEQTVVAYPGMLTDRERLTGTRPSRYSRKPTSSPELAFTGGTLLYPGSLVSDSTPMAPTCSPVTVVSGQSNTYNFYGITAPADGYEIRFINSLGVHENVFVTCLRSVDMTIQANKYAISKQETVSSFSRSVARKLNDREQWKMTSGPLDEQWQQWYLHELLVVQWAWININSKYIPIHILPEETVKGIDRTKPDLLKVEFTVEFDINGSPF